MASFDRPPGRSSRLAASCARRGPAPGPPRAERSAARTRSAPRSSGRSRNSDSPCRCRGTWRQRPPERQRVLPHGIALDGDRRAEDGERGEPRGQRPGQPDVPRFERRHGPPCQQHRTEGTGGRRSAPRRRSRAPGSAIRAAGPVSAAGRRRSARRRAPAPCGPRPRRGGTPICRPSAGPGPRRTTRGFDGREHVPEVELGGKHLRSQEATEERGSREHVLPG